MDILQGLLEGLKYVPDWVGAFVPPLLLFLVALVPARGRVRRHLFFTIFFGGLGVFLLAGKGAGTVCAFVGLFASYAALLLPFARRKKRERVPQVERERENRELRPPKVCFFEEEKLSPEQCGMRLRHAEEMLGNLKKAELSAADRLETDILSRTVSALSQKAVDPAEFATLNDCLASALKLTAKYKL